MCAPPASSWRNCVSRRSARRRSAIRPDCQVALALRDELCVCDLAWVCERPDKLVSHHARALRTAGLVGSRREGKMVMYFLPDSGRALLEAVLSAEVRA